ncbi:hypothetical protein QFC19_001262 [Naganishia cerealis]|uniref:Uncharacterized protein n=1 Tax=Naganishia cerealis TaxID=610337 RepID=A0ACC2WIM9_9TREE|nr:hypothetical protein QFC19_001262 [Naganishia cerealis]
MYATHAFMWAYKSYNDDAPPENEPRFPPPETEEKTSSSWTSWYNKSKKVPAVGKLAGMLSSRRLKPARSVRSRKSRRSRRSSFVSSLFSTRRSDHDGRLDKIIDLLELLAEDKQLQNSTLSRTSSRRSRGSRRKDEGEGEDENEDMTDEDDGPYRQSRTSSSSSRRRVTKPSSSRRFSHGALETIIDAGSRAALQNWRSGSSDGKQGLKERFKSSAEAGTKAASKTGLRQMVHRSSSRRYREDSEDGPVESLEDKANPIISQLPALEATGKDRLDEMLKAHMKNSAKNNVSAPFLATEDRKPSHSRFKQEMLHSPATSEDLDEDLLDGILPPIGRYDFNTKLERPSPAERRHAKHDNLPETTIEERRRREGKSRPLHFDPKTSSVQAFDWPDKEEIFELSGNRASKGKDRMIVTNEDCLVRGVPTTRQKSSSQRPKSKDGLDSEKLLRKLMQVSGKGDLSDMDEDDLRQFIKLTRGHVPSPPETKIEKGEESRRRKEGNSREIRHRPASTTLDDTFGIAWPMTPSHEPSECDFPPEYESPTTDTFSKIQPQNVARPDSLALPQPESSATEGPPAPVIRQETLLFNRVLATMHSCFGT